jgi:hypothetical protein
MRVDIEPKLSEGDQRQKCESEARDRIKSSHGEPQKCTQLGLVLNSRCVAEGEMEEWGGPS